MKLTLKFFVLTLLMILALPASAWVKSISLERTFVGDDIRVLEVAVKCKLDNSERKLRKITSENKSWCSVDLPNLCSNRKVTAARELCRLSRKEFQQLVSGEAKLEAQASIQGDVQETEQQKKGDLMQEKMLIEEQRIQIAQQKIELSRKELELKRRLSN